MDKTKKRRIQILAASVFWLGVWQAAAAAIGQEVFLVSPVQAIGTLVELLPQAEFWQRIGFSAGRILLGFGLGVLSSAVLAVAAEKWEWVDALLAPVMQLVKATPVASFIILALGPPADAAPEADGTPAPFREAGGQHSRCRYALRCRGRAAPSKS